MRLAAESAIPVDGLDPYQSTLEVERGILLGSSSLTIERQGALDESVPLTGWVPRCVVLSLLLLVVVEVHQIIINNTRSRICAYSLSNWQAILS